MGIMLKISNPRFIVVQIATACNVHKGQSGPKTEMTVPGEMHAVHQEPQPASEQRMISVPQPSHSARLTAGPARTTKRRFHGA